MPPPDPAGQRSARCRGARLCPASALRIPLTSSSSSLPLPAASAPSHSSAMASQSAVERDASALREAPHFRPARDVAVAMAAGHRHRLAAGGAAAEGWRKAHRAVLGVGRAAGRCSLRQLDVTARERFALSLFIPFPLRLLPRPSGGPRQRPTRPRPRHVPGPAPIPASPCSHGNVGNSRRPTPRSTNGRAKSGAEGRGAERRRTNGGRGRSHSGVAGRGGPSRGAEQRSARPGLALPTPPGGERLPRAPLPPPIPPLVPSVPIPSLFPGGGSRARWARGFPRPRPIPPSTHPTAGCHSDTLKKGGGEGGRCHDDAPPPVLSRPLPAAHGPAQPGPGGPEDAGGRGAAAPGRAAAPLTAPPCR